MIALAFLATTLAAPQYYRPAVGPVIVQPYRPVQPVQYNQGNFVPIVSESNEINPDGSFRYR